MGQAKPFNDDPVVVGDPEIVDTRFDPTRIFNNDVIHFDFVKKEPIVEEDKRVSVVATQTIGPSNEVIAVTLIDPVTLKRYLVVANRVGGVAIQPL